MTIRNKKGVSSFLDIVVFFFMIFMIGTTVVIYDFVKVEVYDEGSQVAKDITLDIVEDPNNDVYQAMLDLDMDVETQLMPFNLLFLVISFQLFGFSMYKAVTSKKSSIYSTFTSTLGGLIITIYLLHIAIMKLLDWLSINFINYIFGDTITNFIPAYEFVFTRWALITLVWCCSYVLLNYIFGKEEVV